MQPKTILRLTGYLQGPSENRKIRIDVNQTKGKFLLEVNSLENNLECFDSFTKCLDYCATKLGKLSNLTIKSTIPLEKLENFIIKLWEPSTPEDTLKFNDEDFYKSSCIKNSPRRLSDELSADLHNDTHGKLLKGLYRLTANSTEYKNLKETLLDSMKRSGYISYTGDSRDYGGLNCSGMSVIYKVPENKRGNLKPFRGQTIRVCCVGAGSHAQRHFMAGPLCQLIQAQTPHEEENLCQINFKKNMNHGLQVALAKRDKNSISKVLESMDLKDKESTVTELTHDNILVQLCSEGETKLLTLLAQHGVTMARPKLADEIIKNPLGNKNLPPSEFYHAPLTILHDCWPNKTEELLKTYSKSALNDLLNSDFSTTLEDNLKRAVIRERNKRLSKAIEKSSKEIFEID